MATLQELATRLRDEHLLALLAIEGRRAEVLARKVSHRTIGTLETWGLTRLHKNRQRLTPDGVALLQSLRSTTHWSLKLDHIIAEQLAAR